MAAQDYVNTVQGFYVAYYGRWADVGGLDFWTRTLDVANGNVDAVINAFGTSSEYLNTYAAFLEPGTSDITDPEGMVTQLYQFMFNRDPDAAGLAFYVDLLEGTNVSGENPDLRTASLADIALIVFDGAPVGSNDRTILDNKVLVAVSATNTLIETGASYTGDDIADVQAILATVTSDPTTVVTAQDDADVFIRSGDISGQTKTLTVNQDIFNGGVGTDVVSGAAGVQSGGQGENTLNSSDILDGGDGAGDDRLVVNMSGPLYNGTASIKGFETLQLATNRADAAPNGTVFDMNVTAVAGAYEITGVETIKYDQITTGEILTVQNVIPVAADGGTPTLHWANEAGSRAGTIGATYRQASTAGTNDQAITLENVNAMVAGDGILNIGPGIESFTVESTGTVPNNTLNNSAGAADLSSSLAKVTLTGDVAIGRAAGVVTDTTGPRAVFQGLTDRAIPTPVTVDAGDDDDRGLTADASANPTEANLLSVSAGVTEVDATAMTGAANVRFTPRIDGVATNVTFMGGEADDYVEFELGNANAAGNNGNDTFAFINAGGNSTFGEADSVNGGEGTDTLQLGLNGNAQTYNVSETELSNVSSIETIDLRGQTAFLTLSSAVLTKSGTPNTITVRTDKIIQASATDSSNPFNPVVWANNGLENAATDTVNLTKLSGGQGITFLGGSGSDRLMLNDATFNVNQNLDGGVYNDAFVIGPGSIPPGRFDTITVVTNGENVVIDGNDLSKILFLPRTRRRRPTTSR